MYEVFNVISLLIFENGCRNLIYYLICICIWLFGYVFLCSLCFFVGQIYLSDFLLLFCLCSFEVVVYDFGRDICGFWGVIFGIFGMMFVLVVVFDVLVLVYGLMFVLVMVFDVLVQICSFVDDLDIMCFYFELD